MARSESVCSDESLRSQFPSDIWKDYLFNLQSQAPLPLPIYSRRDFGGRPKPMQYGREFHGSIGRDEAEMHLKNKEGAYLVRESQSAIGSYALSMWINGGIKHYMLYFDGSHHYLRPDKKYDNLRDLVADGLIFMFLEARAADYIERMYREASYASSPFVTLQAKKREFSLRRTLKNHRVVDWRRMSEAEDIQSFEKPHNFQVQTFRRFHWCDVCGNFLWGVVAQGVKCSDCDFIAHERCSKKVPPSCSPEMKHLRGVFGADLTGICKALNRVPPFVVDLCIEEIESRGLGHEGMYRVSPSSDELDTLRFTLDQDMETTNLAIYPDIHVICGVLKLYFRLLPIPLIPYDSYQPVIACVQENMSEKAKLKALKTAIQNLPPAHYSTLKAFMIHLAKVAGKSDQNKMTAENLSMILAPSLMRSPHLTFPGMDGGSPGKRGGAGGMLVDAKDPAGFLSNPMLEPFLHQVGGHSSILALSEGSVCKPLVRREAEFYKSLPAPMKEFTAEFKGVVEVSSVEDENGAISLLARAPAKVFSKVLGRRRRSSSKTSASRNRLRILRSGSVEIEADYGDVQFEEKDPGNKETILTANYNPWVVKCHKQHLNKVAGREYAESKISHKFIVLENLTSSMSYPCVLDLKMGVRNFGDDATPSKIQSQTEKCAATTTGKLGVRICGMQVYQVNGNGFLCWNKYHGRALSVEGFRDSLKQFIDNGARLRLELVPWILSRLVRLRSVLDELDTFRFYCSSLLIIYEGDTSGERADLKVQLEEEEETSTGEETKENVKVKLIDFANAACNGMVNGDTERVHSGPDKGLIFGLENLIAIFKSIQAQYKREDDNEEEEEEEEGSEHLLSSED